MQIEIECFIGIKMTLLLRVSHVQSHHFKKAITYIKSGDVDKAVRHFKDAAIEGSADAAFNLGVLWEANADQSLEKLEINKKKTSHTNLPKKDYEISPGEMVKLREVALNTEIKEAYENSIHYFLMSKRAGAKGVDFRIGYVYYKLGDLKTSHEYFKIGVIKENCGQSACLLGTYHLELAVEGSSDQIKKIINHEEMELAKKYLDVGRYVGHIESCYVLGLYYLYFGNFTKAEELWLKCVEVNHVSSLVNLGNLYDMRGNKELAIKYWKKAEELGDAMAAVNLFLQEKN